MGVPITAAAEAGSGFPWALVLALAPSVLKGIFGGKSEEEEMWDRASQAKRMMKMLGIDQPYQSRMTGTVDRALAQALFSRMSKMGNWGWPEGMGVDFSFFEDLLGGMSPGGISSGINPAGLRRRISR